MNFILINYKEKIYSNHIEFNKLDDGIIAFIRAIKIHKDQDFIKGGDYYYYYKLMGDVTYIYGTSTFNYNNGKEYINFITTKFPPNCIETSENLKEINEISDNSIYTISKKNIIDSVVWEPVINGDIYLKKINENNNFQKEVSFPDQSNKILQNTFENHNSFISEPDILINNLSENNNINNDSLKEINQKILSENDINELSKIADYFKENNKELLYNDPNDKELLYNDANKEESNNIGLNKKNIEVINSKNHSDNKADDKYFGKKIIEYLYNSLPNDYKPHANIILPIIIFLIIFLLFLLINII